MIKKGLALILSMSLLLSCPASPAAAAETTEKKESTEAAVIRRTDEKASSMQLNSSDPNADRYYKTIEINPYTFYDVGDGAAKSINDKFLSDLVKGYLIDDYTHIANACFMSAGKCATIDSGRYEDAFNNPDNKSNCFGDIRPLLWEDEIYAETKGSPSKDNLRMTGIHTVSSLQEARAMMASEIERGIGKRLCKAEDILKQAPTDKGALEELKDDKSQPVVYSIVTSTNEKSLYRYVYNSFGLCFYDFQACPITADNLKYQSALDKEKYEGKSLEEILEEEKKQKTPHVSSTSSEDASLSNKTINENGEELSQNVSYTNSSTATLTNSFQQSSSIKYGQSVTTSVTFGAAGALIAGQLSQITAAFNFSFEEMYTKTSGESHSDSKTIGGTTTKNVKLPPDTQITVRDKTTTTSVKVDYDTPVMISYKVAIFSMTGDVYVDDASLCNYNTAGYEHGFYLNVLGGEVGFGNSANENLYLRTVENKTSGRDDASSGAVVHRYWKNTGGSKYNTTNVGVNWDHSAFTKPYKLLGVEVTTPRKAVKYQSAHIPMLSCGCNYEVTTKTIVSEISDYIPLYLPERFVLKGNEESISLTPGQKQYLDNIEIACLNKNKRPYYGFKESDGHWVFCDENGVETTSSPYASISQTANGLQVLSATAPGTAYIRWVLNDKTSYTSAKDYSNPVTKASNLPSPIITIQVASEPFAGTVEVSGEFTGCVGDEGMDLTKFFTTTVRDSTGREVERPVYWEQQELESKGISVSEKGDIKLTQPGTFHVRAFVSNSGTGVPDVYSDWIEITAGTKRFLTRIELDTRDISNADLMDYSSGATRAYDLASYVRAYDQYGKPWTGDLSDVRFELAVDVDNGYIENGILYVTGEGQFPVVAHLDGVDAEPASMDFYTEDNLRFSEQTVQLAYGSKKALEALDAEGKTVSQNLQYISQDPEIATVSSDGLVQTTGVGQTRITLKDSFGNTDECTIIVRPAKAAIGKFKPGRNKLTLKIKTPAASLKADSFEIAYRKKGTSKWKTLKTNKQTIVLKKLKRKKKYQIKARAVKTIDGISYKGDWSKTYMKTVK